MNHKIQEVRAPRASLILTVPAYSFVVALHFDRLGRLNQAAFSAESFVDAADGEMFGTQASGPRNQDHPRYIRRDARC
jgi:hypothetical protein